MTFSNPNANVPLNYLQNFSSYRKQNRVRFYYNGYLVEAFALLRRYAA